MPASDIRRTAGSREECWRRLNGSGRGLFEPVKELRGRIDLVVLLALEPQKRLGDKCVRVRSAAMLLPPWGLTSQPCSPKRLGHRVASSGHGIASACTRLGGSETFL